MSVKESVALMKADAPKMASTSEQTRNNALKEVIEALNKRKDEIFSANKSDMDNAKASGVPESVQGRLKFDQGKLNTCVEGINMLIGLKDPIGSVSLDRKLDDDLFLKRVSVPIGVIGVIFEARPDALVQISTLCIKSGNCAVLKGGKETANTNKVLFDIIKDAAVAAGIPQSSLMQVTAHAEIGELLECEKEVDLLIPRGSNEFVRYIMDNTKIPVMGHADGICHTYLDKDADMKKAIPVIIDAKTQYTAACNATETLLIDDAIYDNVIDDVRKALSNSGVKINEDSFAKEYLDMEISIKKVKGVAEAIEHINKYGSHHTDAIITENDDTAAQFFRMVDSAGVYRNASTRFADGFRYGFGAEVGISTSKIHARGPVGLEGLMTYKYELVGDGSIVADYSSGKKTFKHEG